MDMEMVETVYLPDYGQDLLASLHTLYRNNQLCDISLNTKDRIFTLHKVVLTAASTYFKSLCDTGNMEENTYLLPNMASDHVEALIEFIYTGQLQLSQENVWLLLETATKLDIPQAMKLCQCYLKKNMVGNLGGESLVPELQTGLETDDISVPQNIKQEAEDSRQLILRQSEDLCPAEEILDTGQMVQESDHSLTADASSENDANKPLKSPGIRLKINLKQGRSKAKSPKSKSKKDKTPISSERSPLKRKQPCPQKSKETKSENLEDASLEDPLKEISFENDRTPNDGVSNVGSTKLESELLKLDNVPVEMKSDTKDNESKNTDVDVSETVKSETFTPVVKRGRGRPRKINQSSAASQSKSHRDDTSASVSSSISAFSGEAVSDNTVKAKSAFQRRSARKLTFDKSQTKKSSGDAKITSPNGQISKRTRSQPLERSAVKIRKKRMRNLVNVKRTNAVYKCGMCEAAFHFRSSLIFHERTLHRHSAIHFVMNRLDLYSRLRSYNLSRSAYTTCAKQSHPHSILKGVVDTSRANFYQCNDKNCKRKYKLFQQLRTHIFHRHAKRLLLKCTHCYNHRMTSRHLQKHFCLTHLMNCDKSREMFKCGKCGRLFLHKQNLREHLLITHFKKVQSRSLGAKSQKKTLRKKSAVKKVVWKCDEKSCRLAIVTTKQTKMEAKQTDKSKTSSADRVRRFREKQKQDPVKLKEFRRKKKLENEKYVKRQKEERAQNPDFDEFIKEKARKWKQYNRAKKKQIAKSDQVAKSGYCS